MKSIKLILTATLPSKPGFYYYCNFGEHTPTVVEVTRSDRKLWAQGGEFCFEIDKSTPDEDDNDPDMIVEGKYRFGDQLWCYIPNPYLPGGKKQVKPNCY